MTTSTLRRMPVKDLRFVLGIVAGGGAGAAITVIALLTPWGRERYLDAYIAVAVPYFQTGLCVYLVLSAWSRMSWLRRAVVVGMLFFLGAWAVCTLWLRWPDLPFARAEAGRMADDFMTALSEGDYGRSMALLSPKARGDLNLKDLWLPEARPITWHFAPLPREGSITGTAMFADGVELPVEIRLTWLGSKWGINRVVFGEAGRDTAGEFHSTIRVEISARGDRHGPIEDALHALLEPLVSWLWRDR